MADISSDISDLWWLKQDKPNSSVPALALGAQMAEHKMDSMRQAEQFKTSTAMKLLDLGLEKDRNDLAYKSFQVKQSSDILRAQGMTEIGDFLSKATYNNKLTDPETQGNFWKLTSKYAPFIPEAAVNSMWDNTFKAAMDRKAKAEGGANSTITERDMESWKQYRFIEDNAPTEEDRLNARTERTMFERMKGINQPMTGPPETGQFTTPSGDKVDYFLDSKGNMHTVKPPHDNLQDFQKREYAAELKTLAYKRENGFSEKEKLSKKETPTETYDRLFNALSSKYRNMATNPTGGSSGPAQFKFDPSSGSLIPK